MRKRQGRDPRSLTIKEKTCPVCGKVFAMLDTDAWAYQMPCGTKRRYYCTWKCLCQARRGKDAAVEKAMQKRKIRLDKGRRVAEMLANGAKMSEIAEMLGVSAATAYEMKKAWIEAERSGER